MAAHKVVHPVLTEEAEVAEASDTARSLLHASCKRSLGNLRAAMSMGRLWRDQGKPQQARELLAPVYGWFTKASTRVI